MKHLALSLAFVTTVSVLAFRGTSAPVSAAAPAACPDIYEHQTTLVYEVNGGTIAGRFDRELVLYGDGSARLSSTQVGGGASKCQMTVVSTETVGKLLAGLTTAGAPALCDDPSFVTDMPLSTLTLMRATTDASAHTYSWWVGQGAYGPVEDILQNFVATTFPNF